MGQDTQLLPRHPNVEFGTLLLPEQAPGQHSHQDRAPTRFAADDANDQPQPSQPSDLPPAASPPGPMPRGRLDASATALDTPATPTLTATFPETILEGWPLP